MNNIADFFKESSLMVESFLDKHVTSLSKYNTDLIEGMRYSLFAGGKRLRPALAIASYNMFNKNIENIIPFAAALEMVHTYSLIHDDLPAMDNDDLRRGKPTNHKKFGEAEAILAGDALLTKAFEITANESMAPNVKPVSRVKAIYTLAKSAGDNGMVGGQFADIKAEGISPTIELVDYIHNHKTAALIECAVLLGGIIADQDEYTLSLLSSFGKNIGLAFQVIDDILDITSTSDVLGKTANKDIASNKATYPAVYSLDMSYVKAEEYVRNAVNSLREFGNKADILIDIAKFITERKS